MGFLNVSYDVVKAIRGEKIGGTQVRPRWAIFADTMGADIMHFDVGIALSDSPVKPKKATDPAVDKLDKGDYDGFFELVQGRSMDQLLSTLLSIAYAKVSDCQAQYDVNPKYGPRLALAMEAVLEQSQGSSAPVLSNPEFLKPYIENACVDPADQGLPEDQKNEIRKVVGVPQVLVSS
jgi:hypothetical protein